MADMDVIQQRVGGIPISTEGAPGATCAGCGAPLAADQRYCLACGRPCSPVRLAFLDVLQAEPQTAAMPILGAPQGAAAYAAPTDPPGLVGTLRRWSGVFGLLGVLLASLLIGLLVGHWLTGGSSNPGKQVFEVKGLSGLAAAAPAGSAAAGSAGGGSSGSGSGSSSGHSGPAGSGSSQSHSGSAAKNASGGEAGESASEEKEAAREAQKAKPLPAAKKTSSSSLKKLEHTTGAQHAKEVKAALGSGPIETH